MAKFTATVTRTEQTEIHIDESIFTPEFLEEFSKYFVDVPDLQSLAEFIAHHRFTEGDSIIEGLNYIKADDEDYEHKVYNPGIYVRTVSHDIDIDVDEVENNG